MGSSRARLAVITAALLFSTGGAAIKATPLTAWQVASCRSAIAALVLLIALPEARQRWRWSSAVVGVAYGATMLLFVAANKLTTAANAIFLQSTAPLYLLLAGPWLLREPIRRRDLGFIAALAVGMAIFLLGDQTPLESAPNPRLGNLVALVAGVAWAATVGGLRWIEKRSDPRAGSASALIIGNLLVCGGLLPFALPIAERSFSAWLPVVYLGVVQVGIAYLFFTWGLRHLPALEVSLLVLIEPVLNPLWAWLFQGERPATSALLGGAIIVAAMAARAVLVSSRAQRA